jgi:endogenous inhibitor of DNA gyrase (YacG/DUF329 family)
MMGFSDSRTCDECSEWLTGRQTRYCSSRCKMRAHRREHTTPPAERVCVLCGATFRPLRGKQAYCDFESDADDTCAALQSNREVERLALDSERCDKTCDHCGDWAGWEGVGRPRRFCGGRCKTAFHRAEQAKK